MATLGRYETVSFQAPNRYFCRLFTVPANDRHRPIALGSEPKLMTLRLRINEVEPDFAGRNE